MAWDTAANLIGDAAIELGVNVSQVANPFASTDQNVLLLSKLTKTLGQRLLRAHPWTHLVTVHTFSTASGTADYALPADYARTLDQTHWNRTDAMPLVGPVSGPEWQLLKAQSVTGTAHQLFRVFGDRLQIHPTPSATETVAFEYISRFWAVPGWAASTAYVSGNKVINTVASGGNNIYTCDTNGTSASSGGPTGTTANITDGTTQWDYTSNVVGTLESPTHGTNYILFDRALFVAGLKMLYQRAKGYDSTASQQDFADEFANATSADTVAPVLSLTGRSAAGFRLLDGYNLPDTGYGS